MLHESLVRIVESIQAELGEINDLRDKTLGRSRVLIRSCAHCIRAIHRHEWPQAKALLEKAQREAKTMVEPLAGYPQLYHAGYTQDALKELVEAHMVYAVVHRQNLPTPDELYVTSAMYLRGLAEAATEMRRFILDLMRQGKTEEAEPYLTFMDDVYTLLVAVDYPDAITSGLRRQTDVLRTVLERTRGDLTLSIRQEQMKTVLERVETKWAGINKDL